MILAGDIGGTNTRLALFDQRLNSVGRPYKFATGDGKQLESQMREVLASAPHGRPVTHACLAIAGPVIDGVCRATNIGRTFVAGELRQAAKLESLTLINDLVANAAGVERLAGSEQVTIHRGKPQRGNRAILSPGTGLGEAAMIWDGRHHRPIASEGGHSRFAPTDALQLELLGHLIKKYDTVVCEDVVSGRGLEEVFNFFVLRGEPVSKALQRKLDALPERKRGAVISEAAVKKQSRAAEAAMQVFVQALAVEAASLAVKFLAIGGIYLGGGIPPKILPLLKGKTFRDAFTTHRTMGALLKDVPVRVILNDDTALEGAALYGLRFDA